ncbi:hypothetical protein N7493_011078 [Penicillium malachiteum]|uniref:Heterokaryon incompatibility domain-containing protein n=1 Tax=Penicillium malachiteum TaxID=1324776 RepID=A0AAD6MQY0_9EURO|nr:hypothetical protein N7493_011078 [Penicillium malachiteum]
MAISHVWSDGTGAGAWKDGSVNECLYKFFEGLAIKFDCKGIWWDTISIPREKAARTQAIKKMHDNYEQARITLIHDCFLRDWLWDPRTACFGIIMSPWFSRGWTALELMKSRKVKIIFKGRWGPVIKDLDEEILAKPDEPDSSLREASLVIRNLRQNITKLNDLLTVLRSRYTSWPKDVAVISALLVGVPVQEHQQDIFKSIVRKFGRITPGHLFHNATTMSTSFTWCPAKLFDLPLDTSEPSLDISEEGHVRGSWRVIAVQPTVENHIWWDSTHALIRRQLQHALLDSQNCLFLAELGPSPIRRALLVRKTQEAGHYRYIGAVHFHSEWSEEYHEVEAIVTISSFQDETESQKEEYKSHDIDSVAHDSNASLSVADKSEIFRQAIWTADYQTFLNYMEGDILEVPDKLGRRPLHLAAERGDIKVVDNLLFLGVDHNAQCDQGQTALHYAAWGGSVAVVRLLKDRIERATKNKEGNTALHIAAQMGFAPVVEALANKHLVNMEGSNELEAQDELIGWTPLHCAVDNGNQDIVERLVRHGANVDATDIRVGWTPLHLAAIHGNLALIRMLQAAGANMRVKDNFNWTPFTFAKINEHAKAAELLPGRWSPWITGKAKFWSPLHCKAINREQGLSNLLIGKNGHDFLYPSSKNWMPLKFAVERDLETTARWLLDTRSSWPIEYDNDTPRRWHKKYGSFSKPDPDSDENASDRKPKGDHHKVLAHLRTSGARPNGPWTPMHWGAQNNYAVVLRILVERKEDVNADGPDSWTPLHFAAYFGHVMATRLLLEAGAHKNLKAKSGATPLTMAAAQGHRVVVRMLLEAGARYDEKADCGKTPLAFAAENGHTVVVGLLLQAGAAIDTTDVAGQTPLLYACEKGFLLTVKLLLKARASMEFADREGMPPICVAARYGFKEIVQLLIDAGANVDTRDMTWRTPLMHAATYGRVEIVQLLLDAGAKLDRQDSQGRRAIHWTAATFTIGFYDDEYHERDGYLMDRNFRNYYGKSKYDSEEPTEEQSGENSGAESDEELDKTEMISAFPENAKEGYPPALWESLVPVVRLLLDAGEAVDSKGQNESTPLYLAAMIGHKEMVQLLIDRGADVNSRDRYSGTPLMVAGMWEHQEIWQILLDNGARENLKSLQGFTARDVYGAGPKEKESDFNSEDNLFIEQLRKKKARTNTNGEPSEPWYKRRALDVQIAAEKIKYPIRRGFLSVQVSAAAVPWVVKRYLQLFREAHAIEERGDERDTFK